MARLTHVGCFALAATLWLTMLAPLCDAFQPADLGEQLMRYQRSTGHDSDRRDAEQQRSVNPEWDFMGRTFFVLALANNAVGDTAAGRQATVARIDDIIAQTVGLAHVKGPSFFLLPYGAGQPSSLFVDGEIALMLAARQLVEPDPPARAELQRRVAALVEWMQAGPVLSAPSYPDECWTFCNTTALAAIVMADRALGEDHSAFVRSWVELAKQRLVDPDTGLLVSSYTVHGGHLDGPEGSSLFMNAHNLMLVDPEFARGQYERARELLVRQALGFAWAREWPASGQRDIDSGPLVPLLDASPGSSGMALLGAKAFGDEALAAALLRSMELAAFPVTDEHGRHYAAAGPIGNAVALYALEFGPLWNEVLL